MSTSEGVRRLGELVAMLGLERIEENLFRGQAQDPGWGRLYGGHVLGQALSAVAQTVPAERQVHSLHSYFLRPGRVDTPVVYEVDRIRDGGSFTTRRVVAIQRGKAIFSLSASFQIEEPGLDHQATMPEQAGPEGLVSELELARRIADQIPPALQAVVLSEGPFEVRAVEPFNPLRPTPRPPHRAIWFKARGPVPDDPAVHRYLLAYASDSHFLSTSMFPHGTSWLQRQMQVASVDHAMWFHRPFRVDEWLVHVIDSPSASGARGLVRGQYFDQQGRLVASTTQEGLIRDRSLTAGQAAEG
ncbi:MAG: acyl-CoA thioesterase II [Myxococcales bacterium]|nr:acyl-CoA thioesterase II [Myxococcales bacterium]